MANAFGSNTQIQYNNSGVLDGANGIVYDNALDIVSVDKLFVGEPPTSFVAGWLTVKAPQPSPINLALQTYSPGISSEIGVLFEDSANVTQAYFYKEPSSGSFYIVGDHQRLGGNVVLAVAQTNVVMVSNTGMHVNGVVSGNGSGLTSITATNANNASYIGGLAAANVVSNAQLSANLANYQTVAGLDANIASYLAVNPQPISPVFNRISPVGSDTYTLFWTDTNKTITEIITLISNTHSGAQCNATFYWGADKSSPSATITNINTSNNTVGVHTTSFTNNTPTGNSYIWCTVDNLSHVDEFVIIIKLS